MPAKKSTPKRAMSDEHKAALAAGREAGRAVRAYLEALEENRPKRGRKRSRESMEQRLATVVEEIPKADPFKRLSLIQERIDLESRLSAADSPVDMEKLEAGFIKHAAAYSQNKGISYAAWREIGISPATLKAAGIQR